ncbi:MAG: metallophosphoesterase [Myxococcota bacterium]
MPLPPAPPTYVFALGLALSGVLVVAASRLRSRMFARFRAVLWTILGLCAWGMYSHARHADPRLGWGFIGLHGIALVGSLALVRPRMKPLPYRWLISWPEAWYGAGTLLSFPLAIGAAFGWHPGWWWIGYAFAAVGLGQALTSRRRDVDLVVGDVPSVEPLGRHPHGDHRIDRPLRIAQITDPHLGPFMSQARLRRIVTRAVARAPDLILLTGDFLTMESQSDPSVLKGALEPMRDFSGPVVACFGNHDHEAPDTVKAALAHVGAVLLIDDAQTFDTDVGPVQIVGADFRWRDREAHLQRLLEAHPRRAGHLRILLLHDPGAFRHVPAGEADLVLSGHTHGGQVGLVSLGLPGTAVSLFTRSPDHGFWAQYDNRLYVHRGTGHYGFPIRLGVPAEEGLIRVHVATTAA